MAGFFCQTMITDAFFHFRMHILFAILLLGFQVQGNPSSALSKVWEEWKVKHSKNYDNQVGCFFIINAACGGRLSAFWVSVLVSDRDGCQESSLGAERAAGGPTQPGGIGWETQLHPGAQSSGWHGEKVLSFTFQLRLKVQILQSCLSLLMSGNIFSTRRWNWFLFLPAAVQTHSNCAFTLNDLRRWKTGAASYKA